MRIPSGSVNRYAYFVAVDATDLKTRETGLSSFTVYRSRNGGAAAVFTTPTVNETDVTNMPGVYELLVDEDTTVDAGADEQEMALHITHAGMAPVTRTVEIFRPKATEGETVTAASGATNANVVAWLGTAAATPSVAGVPEVDLTHVAGATTNVAALATNVDAILTDTVEIGAAGAGLTAINLPSQTMDIVGSITGNLSGSVGSVTGAVGSVTGLTAATVHSDLDDLQARLPAALVSGRIDASVGAMAANVMTAAAAASDLTTELQSGLATAASLSTVAGYLDTEIAAILSDTNAILVDTGTTLQAELDAIEAAVITNAAGVDIAADIIALKAETVAILADTAEIGTAGVGLTNINLPNQTMDVVGNITGNLSGSVGSVTGAVGSVTGLTAANIATILALLDDARGEPGQGAPPVNPDLATKIDYLYKFLRNKLESTSTAIKVYDDAGTTVDHKSTQSDDGAVYTRGEFVAGP